MPDVPPRQHVSGSDSIRMNSAEGLPHYDDPNRLEAGLPPESGPAAPGYLALRSQQSEAYGIFQAFQKYVEAERQRAQRRTTTIIVGFAVVVLIMLVGFFAIWTSTMRDMHETQTALLNAAMENAKGSHVDVGTAIAEAVEKATAQQAAILAAERAASEKAAAERAAIEKAADERVAAAEKAKAEMEAATKALQEKLAAEKANAGKVAANAEEKSKAEQSASVSAALAKMNASLEQMRKDNEALKRENAAVREAMAKANAQPKAPATPVPQPHPAQSQTTPATPSPAPAAQPYAENKVVAPEITIKRAQPPNGFSTGTLPLPIGNTPGGTVHWRVMLPNQVL